MTATTHPNSETAPARRWSTLKRLFSVDARSLAAFRIGFGVLIACDLFARFPLIEALYTDQGFVPREIVPLGVLGHTPFDVYRFDGSYAWAAAWIGLTFVCSLLFAVGLWTRLSSVVLWVLMLALARRNQVAVDGGDAVALSLLFWSMFLPLGACWSLDARRRGSSAKIVCSPATAALLLQPALLYFMAGLAKDTSAWRDGYAVILALNETEWVMPLGIWLRQHERAVRVLSDATRIVEIGAPLLLFLPVFTQRARGVAIFLLIGLQVGLASTLRLHFFPFYSSVAWLSFVPSSWWDRLSQRVSSARAVSSTGSLAEGRGDRGFVRQLRGVASAAVLAALLFGVGSSSLASDEQNLFSRISRAFGFAQEWNMYRDIPNDYVRLHTDGVLSDGTTLDLATDRGDLTESPLDDWARSYRGGLILESMRTAGPERQRAFARFICGRWNTNPARRTELVALKLSNRVIWQYVPRAVPEPVVHYEPCVPRA
jgi:uncharacterized membrane protein YphA (DoxX/SURF4 family)